MTVAIIVILLFVSAVAKAVMDKLQFHFDKSVFATAKNKQWWNPKLSNKNKYTISKNKFLTWCFSTWLVSVTDAWHLFGFIRDFSLFAALVVGSGNYWFFLLYPFYRLNFHLFFHYLLNKKP